MSYCRFSEESDVYLYQNTERELVCCACKATKKKPVKHENGKTSWIRPDVVFTKRSEALKHLLEHHVKGHKVDKQAIAQLQREIKMTGDTI